MNVPNTVVPKEWIELSNNLIGSPKIRKGRVSPDQLYEVFLDNRTYTRQTTTGADRSITAFGALWATKDTSWFEFGSFWADKTYHNGISLDIFVGLRSLLPGGTSAFIVSDNKSILSAAISANWVPHNTFAGSPCEHVIDPGRQLACGYSLYVYQPTF